MRGARLIGLCVCCLLAGCLGAVGGDGAPSSYNGTVTSVADGDTIDVRLDDGSVETVRLLGIDTPEVHVPTNPPEFPGVPNTSAGRACLRAVGTNASAFVRSRVDGRRVHLELDPAADRRGDYGRLLAYVFVGDEHLNHRLVAAGYARVYETEFTRRDRFESAAADAMEATNGVWRCRR
jgi:micrococcal nuclease